MKRLGEMAAAVEAARPYLTATEALEKLNSFKLDSRHAKLRFAALQATAGLPLEARGHAVARTVAKLYLEAQAAAQLQ